MNTTKSRFCSRCGTEIPPRRGRWPVGMPLDRHRCAGSSALVRALAEYRYCTRCGFELPDRQHPCPRCATPRTRALLERWVSHHRKPLGPFNRSRMVFASGEHDARLARALGASFGESLDAHYVEELRSASGTTRLEVAHGRLWLSGDPARGRSLVIGANHLEHLDSAAFLDLLERHSDRMLRSEALLEELPRLQLPASCLLGHFLLVPGHAIGAFPLGLALDSRRASNLGSDVEQWTRRALSRCAGT